MKTEQGEFYEIIQTKIKATIYIYDRNIKGLEDLLIESKIKWGVKDVELINESVEEVSDSMGIDLYKNLIVKDMFKSDSKSQFLTSLVRLVKVMKYDVNTEEEVYYQ